MNPNWNAGLPKLEEANSFEEKASHELDKMAEAILTISIDIGNGQIEQLVVKESDDVQKVVDQFSQSHNLDTSQRDQLLTKIRENLELPEESEPPKADGESHKVQYEKEILNTIKRMKEKKQKSPITYKIPVIDQRSKALVEAKGLCNTSVFDRLNRPKVLKDSRPQTTFDNRKISLSEAASIGERLYKDGKDIKKKKDQLAKEVKKKKDAKERLELTFMPKVNRAYGKNMPAPLSKNIYLSQDDMYTFNPKTDKLSSQIDRAINVDTARHKLLYKDAENRIAKASTTTEPDYPFHPKIISIESKNIKSGIDHSEVEHLTNRNDKDLTFHPKVGRAPADQPGIPVSERLYEYKDLYKNKLREKEEASNINRGTHAIIPKSDKLVEKRRMQNYENVFKHLDADNDGLIDPNNVNINSKSLIRITTSDARNLPASYMHTNQQK